MDELASAEDMLRRVGASSRATSLRPAESIALIVELDRLRAIETAARAVLDNSATVHDFIAVNELEWDLLDDALKAAPDVVP